jgi:hypothetical protein
MRFSEAGDAVVARLCGFLNFKTADPHKSKNIFLASST